MFCLRLLHLAVPVDNLIKSRGIYLPSKCVCRHYNHQEERANHLFLGSQLAKPLWTFFSPFFDSRCGPPNSITGYCWNIICSVDNKPPYGYAALTIMLHILWELWKARCKPDLGSSFEWFYHLWGDIKVSLHIYYYENLILGTRSYGQVSG